MQIDDQPHKALWSGNWC